MIKDKLIHPHLDLQTIYMDLGMEYRDQTNDEVTLEAAKAIQQCKVTPFIALILGRYQMCHHHSWWGSCRRIQTQKNVEVSQRNYS